VRPRRVYETVVYATDLEAARAFYRDVLGLREVEDGVFRLDDEGVLLLFDPTESSRPGRVVPSHGPKGAVHVAFAVDSLEGWLERLADHGVALEQDKEWRAGARSLYVRDPAGTSVELVEGDLWPR
jgi:catechol 2,3-dioxygenase-like lactoylglutathione lyase family enzyme